MSLEWPIRNLHSAVSSWRFVWYEVDQGSVECLMDLSLFSILMLFQSMDHIECKWLFIVALKSVLETGMFGIGRIKAASLAILSTNSLPSIPLCPGIHASVT